MTHRHCLVCDRIVDNDSRTSPLSNVALAKELGTSEASVRRHRAHVGSSELSDVDQFFSDVPNAAITSRGKTVRLGDGSYEKITWNPGAAALAEAFTFTDVEDYLDSLPPVEKVPGREAGDTMHVCLADLQAGKTDQNGGTPELLERFRRSINTVEQRVQEWQPGAIVLWELGDVLENVMNTTQQRETNDIDLVTQIRVARRLITEAIARLAPLTPRLDVVSVPSNHGQVRVGLGHKNAASTPSNDYGIEISHMLEEVFAERPEFQHVFFHRPPGKFSEVVTLVTEDGTTISAAHGHQAASSLKMGDWWKGQSHGRRDNLDRADILLFGHHHHFLLTQSGDCRWLMGAPSLDGGSAWFTSKTGESSQSGVLTFTTRAGAWRQLEIC